MPEEPLITINGIMLSVGQAMTLRVALMDFLLHLSSKEFLTDLGEIGLLYRYHAREVSCLMHPEVRP